MLRAHDARLRAFAALLAIATPLVACDDTTGTGGAASTSSSGAGKGSSSSGANGTTSSSASNGTSSNTSTGSGNMAMSFFVSSTGSTTGNLGGLAGADKRCQDLAAAVGAGGKTWHAYLSIAMGPTDGPVHAKDRIGTGPWFNAKGAMVAADLASLHARDGDAEVFLDENGAKVPGQWAGSPTPNVHDVLTGSNADGTVYVGRTCADWTSESAGDLAQVGHSDGLGPNMNSSPPYNSWNSVHENGSCADTAPKGGAGRVYCFAID